MDKVVAHCTDDVNNYVAKRQRQYKLGTSNKNLIIYFDEDIYELVYVDPMGLAKPTPGLTATRNLNHIFSDSVIRLMYDNLSSYNFNNNMDISEFIIRDSNIDGTLTVKRGTVVKLIDTNIRHGVRFV